MVIELRVVQFWSEIILVISNRTRAACSFDFEITRMISAQIVLHSVQLPLFITSILKSLVILGLVQSAIERYNFKRENSPQLPIVQSGEFHNSKEIHRRIAPATPSNSFSKDNEMSQPQPQEKGRFSIIDSGDANRTLMFRSHFFTTACLLVYMLE